MSQPVKLSDALVLDARLAAKEQERSIAGQVEYWAKLGQSIDGMLKGNQVAALSRNSYTESLAERLASVDTAAGRARVEAYLETRPYPHYKEGGEAGVLLRIEEDGTRTLGRFVNRLFVPVGANEGARVPGRTVEVKVSSRVSSSGSTRSDHPLKRPSRNGSGSARNRLNSRSRQTTS